MNKKQSEKFLVTQSNKLVEANYSTNFTALAHKVARLIVSFIKPEHEQETLSVTIEINKLKAYLGWSKGKKWNRFYNDLKDISKKLNEEPIEIPLGGKKVLVAYFLSSYTLDFKEGIVTFDITPKLVPHLTRLKASFTSYQLKYIPVLTSSYAIRIYELLYQYRKIGSRRFSVDILKKKLGAPDKYKYNDLKKRIVVPAQNQLKQNTNLAFIFNEVKTGRAITSIEFVIFNNTPTNSDSQIELNFLDEYIKGSEEPQPAFPEKIIKTLNKAGISEQNIVKYLSQGFEIIKDEEKRVGALKRCKTIGNYYLEKIDLYENSPSAQAKENAAGFLISALKGDWTTSKNLQKAKSNEKAKGRKEAEKKIKALNLNIEKLSLQKDELNKPILAELISDKSILEIAHVRALETMGTFFQNNHRELLSKPIAEQYQANRFLAVSISMELYKMFPERFTEAAKLDKIIGDTKRTIAGLRKKFLL